MREEMETELRKNLRIKNTQLISQEEKIVLKQWLGEDICKLLFNFNKLNFTIPITHMICYKMVVNLNVLCP